MPVSRTNDIELLRAALALGRQSFLHGNLPPGCLLADGAGNVLETGENTVVSGNDNIGHCEINLVHQLAGKYEDSFLSSCTLYAGTEPCPMCTAAVYWSGIGRIVYALNKEGYHEVVATGDAAWVFHVPARGQLQQGGRKILVEGPLLEEEAKQFYKNLPAL